MTTILLFIILLLGIITLIILRDIQKKIKQPENKNNAQEIIAGIRPAISDLYDSLLCEIQNLDEKIEDIKQENIPDEDLDDDKLYKEALEIVRKSQKASASFLQRKLRIGYARSANILDMLEENGIVGPAEGTEPRKVLIK